ncbi:MAG: hypothetical protein ACRDKS_08530 [Actinomycetota bacterium]
MRQAWIVLIVLSAGYLALALYGKYRKLKDDYREAVDEETRRRNQDAPSD